MQFLWKRSEASGSGDASLGVLQSWLLERAAWARPYVFQSSPPYMDGFAQGVDQGCCE